MTLINTTEKNFKEWIKMVNIKLSITFHISSPGLKFTIFIHFHCITTHDEFDNTNPSSMQDACHILIQLHDLALHEFP